MSDSDCEDIAPSQPADDNASLPALFWESMPENPEDHPDYIALKALEEESTPEERAENFKMQGNNKLRVGLKSKNRLLLREAVDMYGKGLGLQCSDTQETGAAPCRTASRRCSWTLPASRRCSGVRALP
eukprot:GHRQ01023907.1.p2 GENE.GHRQ01023907.1~~GHRQ01023907.1.p2  ORF type:complete len:129 (+),score=48.80 GHRQ01023907.1:337-723(+)